MTRGGIIGTAPITGIFSRFDTSPQELIRSLRTSQARMPVAGRNMASSDKKPMYRKRLLLDSVSGSGAGLF